MINPVINPVYCRQLEDKSGFAVCQGIVRWGMTQWSDELGMRVFGYTLDPKWETCLGVGKTREAAWNDYHSKKAA